MAGRTGGTRVPGDMIVQVFLIKAERVISLRDKVAGMVAQQKNRATAGCAPFFWLGRQEVKGLHRRISRVNIIATRAHRSMFQILQEALELPILEHSLHNWT